jgi:uncharacterized protein YkuJ
MRYRDEANGVLVAAEASLRSLAEQALAARDYADVAHIASIADSLRGLTATPRAVSTAARRTAADAAPSLVSTSHLDAQSKARSPRRARRYPRFERDGNKLVKVGWSKKQKKEYQHRIDRHAFDGTLEAISLIANKPSVVIAAEQIVERVDRDGTAVPTYQVYLVFAMLREHGLLKRHGREGYTVECEDLRSAAKAVWDGLARSS